MKNRLLFILLLSSVVCKAQEIKQVGEQYQLINKKGKAISKTYDFIDDFHNGLARVALYNQDSINQLFKITQKTTKGYESDDGSISYTTFNSNLSVEIPSYWGMIDQKGNEVIPLEYEYLGKESEGLIKAQKNNLLGFINRKNETIIDYQYFKALDFKNGKSIVRQSEESRERELIDRNGRIIFSTKDKITSEFSDYSIESYSNGLLVANYANVPTFEQINEYGDVEDIITNELYNVNLSEEGFHLIDTTGKTVEIPGISYKDISSIGNFSDNLLRISTSDQVYFINEKLEIVLQVPSEIKAIAITNFHEGLAYFISEETEKYGFINLKGEVVIPAIYDNVTDFEDGKAWVQKEHQFYSIDQKGNKILTVDISNLGYFYYEFNSFSNWNENYQAYPRKGVINEEGKEIIPMLSHCIDYLGDGLFKRSIDIPDKSIEEYHNCDFWGVVDQNGQTILPIQYKHIELLEDNQLEIQTEDTTKIINLSSIYSPLSEGSKTSKNIIENAIELYPKEVNNKIVLMDSLKNVFSKEYDDIEYLDAYHWKVRIGSKWGVIDSKGKELTSIKYDMITTSYESGKFFGVKSSYNSGLMNSKGHQLIHFVQISDYFPLELDIVPFDEGW